MKKCKRGHLQIESNLYHWKNKTMCRLCRSITNKEFEKTRHRIESSESHLRRKLKYHYSLSLEQYNELNKNQKGLCAVCGKSERVLDSKGRTQRLSVDHDHVTEEVRGLLCRVCNAILGLLRDDVSLIKCFEKYLENPPARIVLNG